LRLGKRGGEVSMCKWGADDPSERLKDLGLQVRGRTEVCRKAGHYTWIYEVTGTTRIQRRTNHGGLLIKCKRAGIQPRAFNPFPCGRGRKKVGKENERGRI